MSQEKKLQDTLKILLIVLVAVLAIWRLWKGQGVDDLRDVLRSDQLRSTPAPTRTTPAPVRVNPAPNRATPAPVRVNPAPNRGPESGDLRAEERAGGHLIRKHVGQTTAQMRARMEREPNVYLVSTFPDIPTAEAAVKETLRAQRGRIDEWLRSGPERLALTQKLGRVVGVTLRRGQAEPKPARGVRIVLVRDRRESDGYRILTGYPM